MRRRIRAAVDEALKAWWQELRRTVEPQPPEIREAQRITLLVRSKVLCGVALGVIPFTILLYNSAFFPGRMSDGLVLSALACGAVLLLLLALVRGALDRYPALAFGLLLGVVSNGTEVAQLAITGGPTDSTFFFPYYLIYFGIAVFFPARMPAVVVTSAALPLGYLLLGYLQPEHGHERFVSNFILLVDYMAITLIANWVTTTIFLREVRARLELEDANSQLRELDRLKSELFANVSHELRTPLTLLLAPVQSLIAEDPGPITEAQRSLLVGMRRNATRLLSLINDLLLLAKLEARETKRRNEPVDLVEGVRRVVEATQPLATSLGLTIESSLPDKAVWRGDHAHFERILLNLVSNACKFSHEGGTIRIAIKRAGDSWRVSVRDEGVGIPAAHLPSLFDRFVQVESGANRRFEGTGIGLAIVKELTTLYGGAVEVESVVGRGSTFRVSLPDIEGEPGEAVPSERAPVAELPPAPERPAQAETVAPPASRSRPCVMVVEDNADLLAYLGQELGRSYEVVTFAESPAAAEQAAAVAPDLILSDVMMPVLDGIELARRLRGAEATREVPILLMSARDDVDTKLDGFAAGVDDYVPKPFQLPELRARIDVHLRLRAQALELGRTAEELREAIHKLKDSEVVLMQQERMALLGTVVAGVAHEMNNPLHFLGGNHKVLVRRLEQALQPDDIATIRPILGDMQSSIERLAHVTGELLRFGRRDRPERENVRVREVIDLALRMVAKKAGERVRLANELPEDAAVYANAQDLFQIVLNVILNGVHALGSQGGEVKVDGRSSTAGFELAIRDDGCGIPADKLGKVFDPFYTTKPSGEGTGLGLAITRKLVVANGGTLAIDSEVGRGTTVTLVLPEAKAA